MRVGFVFTNYNNSEYTRSAIESIMKFNLNESCFIVIVDNDSSADDISKLEMLNDDFPKVKIIYNTDNIGYFKGLNVGIRYFDEQIGEMDCLVIGNNDLVFPVDFIEKLQSNKHLLKKYPVISPDLITLDGVHQNPHVIKQINPLREVVWDIYFSNYYLALAIKSIAKLTRTFTERKDYLDYQTSQFVYQGYGACYILSQVFFNEFGELWAPSFLMGEELFLTKQLEKKNFSVFYESSIRVEHHDHATISKVPSKKMWEISRDSHKIYRKHVGRFSSNIKTN
jgi:glycosyltransferase involved in cell wall biosynthesis